jgi:hypothetical protein
MGGVREILFTDQRNSFRRRLQRALSLSSSGSEDIEVPPSSAAGDTTEDECFQEHDTLNNHRNRITADDSQESPLYIWSTGPKPEEELEQPGKDLSENCNVIFRCLAEWVSILSLGVMFCDVSNSIQTKCPNQVSRAT